MELALVYLQGIRKRRAAVGSLGPAMWISAHGAKGELALWYKRCRRALVERTKRAQGPRISRGLEPVWELDARDGQRQLGLFTPGRVINAVAEDLLNSFDPVA